MFEMLLGGQEINYMLARLQKYGVVTKGPALVVGSETTTVKGSLDFKNNANAFIKIGDGLPVDTRIGDATNFYIDTHVKLRSNAPQMLIGNLRNSNGTGSYWITLNNTFQVASQISLDGYDTAGAVQRFRFGTGTLPLNTWLHIRLQRIGAELKFYLNGTQVGATQTMQKGFGGNTTNQLYVGKTTDNAFLMNGLIDDLYFEVG
ncbi:TPA: hypothetical protein QCH88_004385 [Enterobacter asburiae]|nr:hypothetical protein [Enterobacter asburiae]